jgi:hypothetical protein
MIGSVDVPVTAVREQTVINVFAEVEIPPIMVASVRRNLRWVVYLG